MLIIIKNYTLMMYARITQKTIKIHIMVNFQLEAKFKLKIGLSTTGINP